MQVMSIRPVCPSFVLTLKTPPLVDPHVREDSTQKSLKPMVSRKYECREEASWRNEQLSKGYCGRVDPIAIVCRCHVVGSKWQLAYCSLPSSEKTLIPLQAQQRRG